MKAIKIEAKNAAAIEAALKEANGKASGHTFVGFDEIEAIAVRAEAKLGALDVPKTMRAGAIFTATSGAAVANAYKYARTGTSVKLERRATGWFLVSVAREGIYKEGGKSRIHLTIDQAEKSLTAHAEKFALIK